jgi:hypothetical protein
MTTSLFDKDNLFEEAKLLPTMPESHLSTISKHLRSFSPETALHHGNHYPLSYLNDMSVYQC